MPLACLDILQPTFSLGKNIHRFKLIKHNVITRDFVALEAFHNTSERTEIPETFFAEDRFQISILLAPLTARASAPVSERMNRK